jgi:hypothetical protein
MFLPNQQALDFAEKFSVTNTLAYFALLTSTSSLSNIPRCGNTENRLLVTNTIAYYLLLINTSSLV